MHEFFRMDEIYSRNRWRQIQYLADLFCRRWIKEYLPSLQERQKWNRPRRNFVIGDIVLVADASCPISCWPPARIVDVQRSDDDGFVQRVLGAKCCVELFFSYRPVVDGHFANNPAQALVYGTQNGIPLFKHYRTGQSL